MNYVQFDGHGGRTEKEYAPQQMALTKQEEPRGVFSGMTQTEIYRGLRVSPPKQVAPATGCLTVINHMDGPAYIYFPYADQQMTLPEPMFRAGTVRDLVEVKNTRIAALEEKCVQLQGTIDDLEARLRAFPTPAPKRSVGDILSRSTDRLLDSYGR